MGAESSLQHLQRKVYQVKAFSGVTIEAAQRAPLELGVDKTGAEQRAAPGLPPLPSGLPNVQGPDGDEDLNTLGSLRPRGQR